MEKKKTAPKDPLSLKFKELQAGVEALGNEEARCQQKLELIKKNKGAGDLLVSPYGEVLGLFYLGWCVVSYLLFVDISWFVVILAIIVVIGIVEAVIKNAVKGRTIRRLEEIEPRREAAENALEVALTTELLPRIHALQMATVQNIKDQTAAFYLDDKVIDALLDEEVDEERMERIDLKPGVVLFKSLVPEDSLEFDEPSEESTQAALLSGRFSESEEDRVGGAFALTSAAQTGKWYLDRKILAAMAIVVLIIMAFSNNQPELSVPEVALASASSSEPSPVIEVAETTPAPIENSAVDAVEAVQVADVAALSVDEHSQLTGGAMATAISEPGVEQVRAQPSFDCAKASSTVEHMICGSNQLAELDQQMAVVYKQAIKMSSTAWAVRETQQAWRRNRDVCSDVLCVAQAYTSRIAELDRAF